VENAKQAAGNRILRSFYIQRQPGAKSFDVVESGEKTTPQLSAASPRVKWTSHGTVPTIRASSGVQFNWCSPFALVVMVIFLFSAAVRATIIQRAVHPSIIGTFAGCAPWLQLTTSPLMRLKSTNGFVVDGAPSS